MTKDDISYFRDTLYKGKPLVIICDNEHNFFDNYPGHCFPVWDDEHERVLFLQTNQEDVGFSNSEFPYTVSITEYEHIQCIKVLVTRKETIEFLNEFKSKLPDGKYDYNIEQVSKAFGNHTPSAKPYK